MGKWDWMDDCHCGDSDVDFFAEDDDGNPIEEEIERAKSICAGCPVRRQCLKHALDNEERFGVWGGADETTIRRALNIDQYGKPIVKAKPIACPLCSGRNVDTVEVKRTTQHLRCTDCSLDWWARVPTTIVKINAADLEDEEDGYSD